MGKQSKLLTLSTAEQKCGLKWACPGRGWKECKGILHSLWRYLRDMKWVEIRGLFLVPPFAVQTDTEQKWYKNHRPERKESTGERKSSTLYLMMLFNVNTHTDFWTSRDCLQCWLEQHSPNVPSIAEKAGDCLYPRTHCCDEVGCWIVISLSQAATHTQVPEAGERLPSLLY